MSSLDLANVLRSGGVEVEWQRADGAPVVTVTLDRADTRNAQTPATWRALVAVGDNLPTGTRVVVLRGAGTVFSSGIDLRSFTKEGVDGESLLAQISALDDAAAADLIATLQAAFTWWHDRDDVITVAAVQGAAVGAGFQLALACDLRLCTTEARFAMKETSLGLVPDLTGTHPLVSIVGYSRALELCATGRWIGAEESLALGIATSVSEPSEFDNVIDAQVNALLAAPEASVRATKAVLRRATVTTPDEQRRFERETQVPLLRGLIAAFGQ